MRFIYIFLGAIISFFEKLLWHIKRKYQVTQFKNCGKNVYIGKESFFTGKTLTVGDNVYIASRAWFSSVHGEIIIGSNVMFGPDVHIHGGNHEMKKIGVYMKDADEKAFGTDGKVIIKDDCWIGANAIILKGVTVGEGSVIAAGAIVAKDVPPYSIYISKSSTKIIPRFSEEELMEHKKILSEKYGKK